MNKVRQDKVEAVQKGLAQGKSIRQAMIDAGYAETTANTGIDNQVVKEAIDKNRLELAKQGMTPERLIKEQQEMHEDAKLHYSQAKTKQELKLWNDLMGAWNDRLSKHMLGDKHDISGHITHSQEEEDEYNRLRAKPQDVGVELN